MWINLHGHFYGKEMYLEKQITNNIYSVKPPWFCWIAGVRETIHAFSNSGVEGEKQRERKALGLSAQN